MTQSAALAAARAELVDANHILAQQRVVDGFGHVSVRHPDDPSRFLLSRSMAPAMVTEADILSFDLQGAVQEPDAPAVYLERFIHAAIYRRRLDVAAVVHSHSASVVPFSVSTTGLRPVCHMCGFLGRVAPVFEIRETVGDGSDMLIRDNHLGEALADRLGDQAVVLMRGHGSTVVGVSLRQAVFRAIYTEVGAKLQAEAMRLGGVTYLTEAEAQAAAAANDGQIGRAWELWRREATR